jgi:hypothetical protein
VKDAIILGSGRSGTSMVGGLFHEAGYAMGSNLLRGKLGNPNGLFESRDINRANETLMRPAVRLRPSNRIGKAVFRKRLARRQLWIATPPVGAPIASPSREIATQIEMWTSQRPFAFKDPRFSFTLSAWRPWLPADCSFVVVFREPGRTAESILRECREAVYLRDVRMTFDRALDVWACVYDWILRVQVVDGDWTFVHYDQIVRGPGVARLEAATGAVFDRGFVDERLSRSRGTDAPLPATIRRIYEELCSRAGYEP